MEEIDKWNESRKETKEEVQLQMEKQTWKDLMASINNMGAIPKEPEKFFYKRYHKAWAKVIDCAYAYQINAGLDEKYGLNEEV